MYILEYGNDYDINMINEVTRIVENAIKTGDNNFLLSLPKGCKLSYIDIPKKTKEKGKEVKW